MGRYFFDVTKDGEAHRDDAGDECADFEDARGPAQSLLPDIAREELLDGDLHRIRCDVRDETGRTVYRGEITDRGTRDPEDDREGTRSARETPCPASTTPRSGGVPRQDARRAGRERRNRRAPERPSPARIGKAAITLAVAASSAPRPDDGSTPGPLRTRAAGSGEAESTWLAITSRSSGATLTTRGPS